MPFRARPIPGAAGELSEFALGVGRGRGAGPPVPSEVLRTWRAASTRGANVVDLTWAPGPEDLLGAIAASRGAAGRWFALVGVDPRLPPPVGPFPDLPGLTRIALVRDPEPGSLERSPIAQALRGSVGRGELASWGAAYTSIDGALAGLADALASGSRLVAAPANLLVARSTRRLGAQLTRGGAGLVAQDPFSSGRLDGRLFEETRWAIGPSELPRNLTSLQESLGPVTRLGFLSEGRRRTLPQAALRFLLDLPAVVTIAWDFLTPRILADSEALDAVPSLSEAEIARVDAVTGTGT